MPLLLSDKTFHSQFQYIFYFPFLMVLLTRTSIKPLENIFNDNFRYIAPIKCSPDIEPYETRFFTNIPYVIIASIVSFIGLSQNDSSIIIASMLFSPIGGQIIRSSIAMIINNKSQLFIGIQNHFLFVAVIWLVGYTLGHLGTKEKDLENNNQMMNRTMWTDTKKSIVYALVMAIVSGIVLALSHGFQDSSLIIAIGIGASLLPPIVNSGMLASLYAKTKKPKYKQMAINSLGLWFMNYIVIMATIVIVFKVYC
jgi:uncharacterized membrane protein